MRNMAIAILIFLLALFITFTNQNNPPICPTCDNTNRPAFTN